MSVFQMSLYGSVLILIILILRALFKNMLPKKTFLFLWAITLSRLLIPISLASKFSLYSLINSIKIPSINTAVFTDGYSPQHNTSTPQWYTIVWIIGVIVLALLFFILYLHHRWNFNTSLPVSNSTIDSWLSKHQILRDIRVRKSGCITSPLTYGIFKPVILINENTDLDDTNQLEYVLLHEYIHIRHFDGVLKFIAIVCLCLHWCNPLVWVMYFVLNRDVELACDESVISYLGENHKSSYALTLINMEERKSVLRPFCNNYSKIAIEERIEAIMKFKKISVMGVIIAVALIITTAAVFTTTAATNKAAETTSQSESYSEETFTNDYKLVEDEKDSESSKEQKVIVEESDDSKLEVSVEDVYYLVETTDDKVQIVDEKTGERYCEIMVEEK